MDLIDYFIHASYIRVSITSTGSLQALYTTNTHNKLTTQQVAAASNPFRFPVALVKKI